MIIKMSSKNQLTIPESIINKMDNPEYFEITYEVGRIILTPISMDSGDKIRSKFTTSEISNEDIESAIDWYRNK